MSLIVQRRLRTSCGPIGRRELSQILRALILAELTGFGTILFMELSLSSDANLGGHFTTLKSFGTGL